MDASLLEWKKGSIDNLNTTSEKNAWIAYIYKSEDGRARLRNGHNSGFDGYTIVMSKLENAHVVHYIGGLRLPVSFAALGDFKDTLDLLCLLKHHQLRLKKTIKPIHYRPKSAAPCGRYRITLEPGRMHPKYSSSPLRKETRGLPRLKQMMIAAVIATVNLSSFNNETLVSHFYAYPKA
ncbi:hypothetical protein MAM1_0131d06142 [Mucor ambiguus]|uniref:Uncharacterized protein n=1 Tax=Mucor ambiguus TaxID=91626 RepID=A0A0C9LVE9_9FUNG|nr:hypothetical protein MAM1_0131d06142 [Mucor ambiguus]